MQNKTNTSKLKRRASLIAANSLNSLVQPAVNVLFSLVVIKISGVDTWGSFVYYFLWASLASFIMSWGNKEYLIREFSKKPAEISGLWRESFFTRIVLIIPISAIFFFSFSVSETLLLVQWTAALFFTQSFDVLTIFHRRFIYSLIIESAAGIILLAFVFFKAAIDIYTIYLLYLFIRVVSFLFLFRKDILRNFNIKFRLELLKGSIVFFLLSLTGLLGSRVDQYCVSILLSKEELGKYQVLKSFLLYFQAIAGFIILPYVKNIYRLKDKSVDKIINKLFLTGVILTLLFVITLYILMNYVYLFPFTFGVYFYSALIVLPVYYYTVIIYKLLNKNKLNSVNWISSVTILISLILNVIFIPLMNIEGGLLASVISGFAAAVFYFIYNKICFAK